MNAKYISWQENAKITDISFVDERNHIGRIEKRTGEIAVRNRCLVDEIMN